MEVHAHTHHGKKKWTEYIWEFLMLFLAVFCGFLAENIREHKIEKDRENKFIVNLVDDLEQDTVTFTNNIATFNLSLASDDSLIQLLNSPDIKKHGASLYFTGRLTSRSYPLAINDATIQQLKNSGGFRLISKDDVAKKIIEYYNRLVFIKYLEDVELLQSEDYRKISIDVFDPVIFNSMISREDNSIVRPSGNPALLTYDVQVLRRLSGMGSYHRNCKLAISNEQSNMKKAAIELIALIKKEYRLK